ncbi:hypothetical protein PSQ39_10320 [Curvibacter sp. HBC28]|uniref:Uncharacterized protein n=1 Tax=Curvibacter microcysteis TaxID=3026419 RepID=A0ABT5MIL2_9BURK|nr:hypothetical protein [Curvibacter sp. HBC28]MDD0815025.1 hypothetical protein [Curvibacter sp. HBC28]
MVHRTGARAARSGRRSRGHAVVRGAFSLSLGWLLLLALWLAPVLGQMHRAYHASGPRAVPTAGLQASFASPPTAGLAVSAPWRAPERGHSAKAEGPGAQSWLERLFAAHTSDADCLVFDQLSPDSAATQWVMPDAALPPLRFVAWWLDAALVATTAAPCQARAPPVLR